MPTGTIYFDSTDMRPSNLKWRLSLALPPSTHPLPEVRGEDVTVPSATGRVALVRKGDRLIIPAELFVGGQGSGGDAQRADFLASWDTLGQHLDPTADPEDLIVYGPLHGVASGKKRTISCRFLNAIPRGGIEGLAVEYSVEFECVSGLVWVEADNP